MIVKADFKKGQAKITVQSLDDLWVLSQIISTGAFITGKTTRRISLEQTSVRKPVFLKIKVKEIEFHKYANVLRAGGIVVEGPEEVELHSHHTFNIETGTEFKLEKEFADWEIKKLKKAQKESKNPQVLLAVVEEGECELAVVREYGLDFIGKLAKNIPGKNDENHEKYRNEFYAYIVKELERIAKEKNLNLILAGGNIVVADTLKKYLPKNTKIKTVHISSGSRSGVHEMLARGYVEELAKDLRFAHEARIVEELLARLGKGQKAVIGFNNVKEKVQLGAVEALLVTDKFLVSSRTDEKYKELENLMRQCEELGGKVEIISTEHEYGEKLQSLKGIAVLLRY